jgi:hypothetical protein
MEREEAVEGRSDRRSRRAETKPELFQWGGRWRLVRVREPLGLRMEVMRMRPGRGEETEMEAKEWRRRLETTVMTVPAILDLSSPWSHPHHLHPQSQRLPHPH